MYRKDQVMNMAKAKIVKRKKRLRIEGLATLLLTLSIFGYFGAKFALKSYNITLQLKAQESERKANTLKEDVANLEADITKLEDRDRVLGMAEKEGIKTNQDNVVVVDKDEKK